jgi:hypothetical protein
MADETPYHFSQTFTIGAKGAAVVEQDSPEDMAACVYRIAVCQQGYRDDLPAFGIPQVAYQALPLDLSGVEEAISRWEPRARENIEEHMEALAGVQVDIEVF